MQTRQSAEDQIALREWKGQMHQAIADDPDSDITDLVPALARLLGWLSEGEKCEQKGMRVVAMLYVVRPDFLKEKSLGRMSATSKENLSKLVVDFRLTFGWRESGHQAAKRSQL
jgi:hypothetical protein